MAKHNSTSSCWVVIDKTVYDLTKWIGQHPGGPDQIIGLCGTDASAAFKAQHGAEGEPAEKLAGFKLGALTG